jgi:hypothetical protein
MLDQTAVLTRSGSFELRHRPLDPCRRRMIFGPVRPMERPSLLRRLIGA